MNSTMALIQAMLQTCLVLFAYYPIANMAGVDYWWLYVSAIMVLIEVRDWRRKMKERRAAAVMIQRLLRRWRKRRATANTIGKWWAQKIAKRRGINEMLILGVIRYNYDMIIYALKHGAFVPNDSSMGGKMSMLQYVVAVDGDYSEEQLVAIVELMLQNGADPNFLGDPIGHLYDARTSALFWAIRCGIHRVVELLLAYGAKTGPFDIMSSIAYALEMHDPVMLSILIDHDVNPNEIYWNDGWNAGNAYHYLYLISFELDWDTFKALFDILSASGPNIDARDYEGETPLHYAIRCRDLKRVRLLLERGADVNARNKRGMTPLRLAKQMNSNAIVELITAYLTVYLYARAAIDVEIAENAIALYHATGMGVNSSHFWTGVIPILSNLPLELRKKFYASVHGDDIIDRLYHDDYIRGMTADRLFSIRDIAEVEGAVADMIRTVMYPITE